MKVAPNPIVVRAAVVAPTVDTPTTNASPPTPPEAPFGAATPGGLTSATSTSPARLLDARVKAPWSKRANEITAHALDLAKGTHGDVALAAVLDAVLATPELRGATLSAAVSHGGSVILRGTDSAVNPCSNSKLVTAAYALTVLGPAHRFATELRRADDGALVIRGAFDPTLTAESLGEIARALKARGITSVPRIVVDNGALAGTNVPAAFATYGDEDWEYVARPEPLSVNKNSVHITVRPNGVVDVDQSAFTINNRVTTVPAGTPFKIGCDELDNGGVLERGPDGRAIIDVWGTIAADYSKGKELVMKSPAPVESFAAVLQDAFERAGVHVGGVDITGAIPPSTLLYTHQSKPLSEILRTSLSTSNAFDHEMFALAAAMKETGGPVTLKAAAEHLEAFLHDVIGGEGAMVNASGIGNENRLRAQDIATILAGAATDARSHSLLDALAQPGQQGTLKSRMLDTAAEGAFRGKTGTGEGAAALSGVIGDVVMSVLVTDAGREGTRAALDGLAAALATLVRDGRA